jgi:hypothetical protein
MQRRGGERERQRSDFSFSTPTFGARLTTDAELVLAKERDRGTRYKGIVCMSQCKSIGTNVEKHHILIRLTLG